jgi:hypothetical protein
VLGILNPNLRADLYQLLPRARQRPALDRPGRRKSAQEIADIVCERMEEKASRVGANERQNNRIHQIALSLIHCSRAAHLLYESMTFSAGLTILVKSADALPTDESRDFSQIGCLSRLGGNRLLKESTMPPSGPTFDAWRYAIAQTF